MPTITLTSIGQLTVPKAIRDRLGPHEGDRVEFRVTGEGQVVVEAGTVDLRDLRGALKGEGTPGIGRGDGRGRDDGGYAILMGLDTVRISGRQAPAGRIPGQG